MVKTKMKTLIKYIGINFGADPELFLAIKGKIIGSEKVIPEDGLAPVYVGSHTVGDKEVPKIVPQIVRDGVQVEFNVVANSCRQSFSTNLSQCFRILAEHLASKKTLFTSAIKPVFDITVEVDPDEMQSLHPKSQQFGCAPSENAYGKEDIAITDASQYFYRSAGGHLHLGVHPNYLKEPNTVVMLLDVLLGNTCVLLDRSEGNIERRKVYGKAGEYRLPKHGLEYRVLSNFWLRSYQTMSFVMAVARFAICVAQDKEATEKLLKAVDLGSVRYAINNNDYDVALENFSAIKDIVRNYVAVIPLDGTSDNQGDNAVYPLEGSRMDAFVYFAEKGLDHWFTEDIFKHWTNHNYRERNGWENFIDSVVAPQMPQKVEEKELVTA